ncbi:hypothetical protein [Simonsiella muelleri]|uniref:hypothetical protein n=1 Tax=Simonsiella muelleri TaxID=72 RepID=UPI0002FC6A47|nr:hypothetical protein [Simonsiella muelleri]
MQSENYRPYISEIHLICSSVAADSPSLADSANSPLKPFCVRVCCHACRRSVSVCWCLSWQIF